MKLANAREAVKLLALVGLLAFGLLAVASHYVPESRPDLLVYGDSIVDDLSRARWHSMMWVEFDAKRGRQLTRDFSAAQRIIARKPHAVWIAIGTNDFGRGVASPAQFRTTYAALLDKLEAGLPEAGIYAQTPMYRQGEFRHGVYLQQYRDAITAECAVRPRVRCIDGRDILAVSQMPDGLHPSERAQSQYANFVEDVAEGQ